MRKTPAQERWSTNGPAIVAFCQRIAREGKVSVDEVKQLISVEPRAVTFGAGGVIVRERSTISRPLIISSGWACLQRILVDGNRQIFDILVPGDTIGFGIDADRPAAASFVALTPMLAVNALTLRDACGDVERYPHLADAFTIASEKFAERIFNHLIRLGRLTAYERLAHLFLDLFHRVADANLSLGHSIPFPLTQEVLGDTLGLSAIHINRTIRQLRQDGMMELQSGRLTILNPSLLSVAIGDPPEPGFMNL